MPSDAVQQLEHRGTHVASIWTLLRWATQAGIGILILWWIVHRFNLDTGQLWGAVTGASLLSLTLAVIFFVISIVLKAIQFRICLLQPIPSVYLLGVFLSQNALLTFLPWRTGEIGLPLLLRRDRGISIVRSASSILIIRLIDLVIIGVVAVLGGVRLGFTVPWVTIALTIVAFGSLIYAANLVIRRRSLPQLIRNLRGVFDSIPNRASLARIVLLSSSVFVMSTFQSAFALQAFGLKISVGDVAVLNAGSLFAAVLPLHPPGGWGTIDFVQVVLLQYLNFQPDTTTPIILVTHFFYTFIVLLGGFLGWWLCRSISRT